MKKAFSKERIGQDILETDTDRANFETKSKFSILRQLSIQNAKTKSTYVDRQYESALNYSLKFNEYRIAEERKRINQVLQGIKVEKGKSLIPSPDVSVITDGKKFMQGKYAQPSYQSFDPNMSVSSKESKKDNKKTLFYDFSNMYKVDKFKSEYLPRIPSDESLSLKKKLPSSEFEKNIKTVLSRVTDPKVNHPREVLRSLLVQIPRGSDPYDRLQGEERRQLIEENLDFDSKPIDVNMNITDGEGRVKVIKHKFNPGKIQKQIFEKYSNYLADNRYDTASIVDQMKHEYTKALDRIQRNVVVIKVPRTYKVWLQDYNDFYHKHEDGEDCEDFPDYLVQTQLDAYLDKKLMREASKAIDETTPIGSHLKSSGSHKRNKTTAEARSKMHEERGDNEDENVNEEDEEEEEDEDEEDEDEEDDSEYDEEEEEEEVKPKKKKKFFYDRSSSEGSSSSSSSSSSSEEESEEEEEEEEEEEAKSLRREGSNSEKGEGQSAAGSPTKSGYRSGKSFGGSKKKIDIKNYLDSDMPVRSNTKKVDSDDSSSSSDGDRRKGGNKNYGYYTRKGTNRTDSKTDNSPSYSKKDTKRQESKVREGDTSNKSGEDDKAEKVHRKREEKASKKHKKLEKKDDVIEESDKSSERNEGEAQGEGEKKRSKSHKKHKKHHKKSKNKEKHSENDQGSNNEEGKDAGEGVEGERSSSKTPSKSKKLLKKKTTSKSPSHFDGVNSEEQGGENSPAKSPSRKKKPKKNLKEGVREEEQEGEEVNEEENGKKSERRKKKSKSPKSKGQRTVGRLPTEQDSEDQAGQETVSSKKSKKKSEKRREDTNGSESPEGEEKHSREKKERKGHKKGDSRSRYSESPDEDRKEGKRKNRENNSSVSITKSGKNQVDLNKYREISEEGEENDEEYNQGEESRESIPEIKKVVKRIKSAKQVAPEKKGEQAPAKHERRNSMKNPKPAPPAPKDKKEKKESETRGTSKDPQRTTNNTGNTTTGAPTAGKSNASRPEIGRSVPVDPRTKKPIQGAAISKQQPPQTRIIEQKYNNNVNSKYYVPGVPMNRNEGLGILASGKGFSVAPAKKPAVAGGRGTQQVQTGTSSHTRKPEGAPSTNTRPRNLPTQKSFVVKQTNISPLPKPQGQLNRGGSLRINKAGEIGKSEEELFNEEMEYLEEQEGEQEGMEENNEQNEQFDLDKFINDLKEKDGIKPSIVDMLLAAPSVLENDITIKERQVGPKVPLHLKFENDEYEKLFEKVYVWHNDLKTDLQDLSARDHLSELQDSDGSDEAPKQKKKKNNPLETEEDDD